ncbi:MAG: polysaccharide deacetylase family protein [Chitinophagaceae bacterium]
MVNLISAVVIGLAVCALIYTFAGITFNGLPVLMYHKVADTAFPDSLTVSIKHLENHFRHLVKEKYTTIFLSELLDCVNGKKALPSKPVLLTFDDGYKDNYSNLYPLLQRYGMKANIFLIAGLIQSTGIDVSSQTEYLNVDETKMMSDAVQYGLHTYEHKSYDDLTIAQISEDVKKCRLHLDHLGILYQPCLAYTYGAYPKKDPIKRNQLFQTLQANGIQLAFRIGNRVNKLPVKNKFLLQRIDVRGDESFSRFKFILVMGRKILVR